jgi:hypothetical protein
VGCGFVEQDVSDSAITWTPEADPYSRHLSDLQEPGISSCSSNQSHYVIMVCSFLGCVSGGLAEATSMVVYASVRHIQKSVREGSCLSVKEIF